MSFIDYFAAFIRSESEQAHRRKKAPTEENGRGLGWRDFNCEDSGKVRHRHQGGIS
jgi:hypothetical protein